ncbi:MAG: two-component system chemotaxis family sensor histidine kinase and response regulator WspE [Halothiobacillaceae bacterium]|nr:MAG: two-component system chemotaxis family sensor histidine kinase and response regulator WspE [Halothiobacillaceae bacterium]
MALSGELMVHSKWLRPYGNALRRLKRDQSELVYAVEELKDTLRAAGVSERILQQVGEIQQRAVTCRDSAEENVVMLEAYDVRTESLATRLRLHIIASRMRPFKDGVHGLPRIVRDVARSLGKQVELQMEGLDTQVDRDILERIEGLLGHLLNNAIDHGIETVDERRQAGKAEKGVITLSAYHHGGMLYIAIKDDGRGIDFDQLRKKVVQKGLVREAIAHNLTQQELADFMFLPGFSTRDEVSALSGRGVGLDVVQDVMQEMCGAIEVSSEKGRGTHFKMRLPLTLSVVTVLLVEIAGEAYAVPLSRIEKIVRLPVTEIQHKGEREWVTLAGEALQLAPTATILELPEAVATTSRMVAVVVLANRENRFGFVVDRFLQESELVAQVMPKQLQRIRDINAMALMEDGTPVMIIDVDDLLRSARVYFDHGGYDRVNHLKESLDPQRMKRILVVDDSITVREIERKLLVAAGYEVDVAVDGMDGWNAIRNNVFDLVITDVDMPRLNGLQLLGLIKQDPVLKAVPVMVVSYKDRNEDQLRALQAGANYFLAKANFHDETLRRAVGELIGGVGDENRNR